MTATHQVAWIKDEAGMPEPWVVSNRGKRKAAWAPQLGSQQAFCRVEPERYSTMVIVEEENLSSCL